MNASYSPRPSSETEDAAEGRTLWADVGFFWLNGGVGNAFDGTSGVWLFLLDKPGANGESIGVGALS
jgi:hypothetical protein